VIVCGSVLIPYIIKLFRPGYLRHLELGRQLKNLENLFLSVGLQVQELQVDLQVSNKLTIPEQHAPFIGSIAPPADPREQKSYPPFIQFKQLPDKVLIV
jgi:hypothetical protein